MADDVSRSSELSRVHELDDAIVAYNATKDESDKIRYPAWMMSYIKSNQGIADNFFKALDPESYHKLFGSAKVTNDTLKQHVSEAIKIYELLTTKGSEDEQTNGQKAFCAIIEAKGYLQLYFKDYKKSSWYQSDIKMIKGILGASIACGVSGGISLWASITYSNLMAPAIFAYFLLLFMSVGVLGAFEMVGELQDKCDENMPDNPRVLPSMIDEMCEKLDSLIPAACVDQALIANVKELKGQLEAKKQEATDYNIERIARLQDRSGKSGSFFSSSKNTEIVGDEMCLLVDVRHSG